MPSLLGEESSSSEEVEVAGRVPSLAADIAGRGGIVEPPWGAATIEVSKDEVELQPRRVFRRVTYRPPSGTIATEADLKADKDGLYMREFFSLLSCWYLRVLVFGLT